MTSETTQAIPTAGGPLVSPPQPAATADATQMGASTTCPVCGTVNSGLERYCTECGFLLASTPGEALASEGTPSPELVETATGRRFALKPGANTVGREACDVLVMDPTVSRRHARIDVGPGGVAVTDLGSSNGTLADGKPLTPQQPASLSENSVLRFGNASFTIVGVAVTARGLLPGQEAPSPAPAEPQAAKGVLPPSPGPASAPSEPPVARLKPVGPNTQEVPIAVGKTTIGRRADNAVALSGDPYVSGHHAEILCDATGCYLIDVGSKNGSIVNGERLEPGRKQLLLDGDEVKLGQTSFVFETLEGPPAQSAGGPIRMGGDR